MAKSYKGLQKQAAELPADVKAYLSKLDGLLADGKNFEIVLAYLFMKIEQGHHRALKCGLIRRFKCNSQRIDDALAKQHFTRPFFQKVLKDVLGAQTPKKCSDALKRAETARDSIIHGKELTTSELRDAVSSAIIYVAEFGPFVASRTGINGNDGKNPFGNLQGLASRMSLLDPTTSYWLLKGVGLYTSETP